MVGKLSPAFFPAIFGPGQDQPLDADGVARASRRSPRGRRRARPAEAVADGFIRIAVENMANAIKKISVQRGYDVTRYALNCFGGAGGQHACLVADALGMTTSWCTRSPRCFRPMAWASPTSGPRASGRSRSRSTTPPCRRPRPGPRGAGRRDRAGRARGPGRGGGRHRDHRARPSPLCRHRYRLVGRRSAAVARDARRASRRPIAARFGFIDAAKPLVVEALSVEAVGGGAAFEEPERAPSDARAARRAPHALLLGRRLARRRRAHPRASDLAPGQAIAGPALLVEPHQTIVVEAGWRAELTARDHVLPRRVGRCRRAPRSAPRPIR